MRACKVKKFKCHLVLSRPNSWWEGFASKTSLKLKSWSMFSSWRQRSMQGRNRRKKLCCKKPGFDQSKQSWGGNPIDKSTRYGAKPSTPARLKGHNSTAKVHIFHHFKRLVSLRVNHFVGTPGEFTLLLSHPDDSSQEAGTNTRLIKDCFKSGEFRIIFISHIQNDLCLLSTYQCFLRCKSKLSNYEFCLRQAPWQRWGHPEQGGWRREQAPGWEANPCPRYSSFTFHNHVIPQLPSSWMVRRGFSVNKTRKLFTGQFFLASSRKERKCCDIFESSLIFLRSLMRLCEEKGEAVMALRKTRR